MVISPGRKTDRTTTTDQIPCEPTSVHMGHEPWQPFTQELGRLMPGFNPGLSLGALFDNHPENAGWPGPERLNAGFTHRNGNGKVLEFVPQDERLPFPELPYEARIWLHGLIATRPNWHDVFNALIWRCFPRSKAALNAAHWTEMQHQSGQQRSPRRDALTLFDECGVVVVSESATPLQALVDHQWQAVFGNRHCLWQASGVADGVRVVTFGHAMLEKYRAPYVGMTAKAALVKVPRGFLDTWDRHPDKARQWLDRRLAAAIARGDFLRHSHELAPLPVLGIPGWWLNRPGGFLDNRHYFRPPSARTGERKVLDLSRTNRPTSGSSR